MKVAYVDNMEVCTTKLIDNQSVIFLTSYETPQLLSKIKHWDRQQRKKIEIECSTVICTYNKDVRKDVSRSFGCFSELLPDT